MPTPYYSATLPPDPVETFETTIDAGGGADFTTLREANLAFDQTDLAQARFYIVGTVEVGSVDMFALKSIDFVGSDDTPTIELNNDIRSAMGTTEEIRLRFIGLTIKSTGVPFVELRDARASAEFNLCVLDVTATASGPLIKSTGSGANTIVCRNCILADNTAGADGFFQVESSGVMSLYLHACAQGGATTGAFLFTNSGVGTEINIHFLDGTSIRDFIALQSGATTANLFQDGSSTYDVSKAIAGITTVNQSRLGSALFSGTYTGDGSTSLAISGWQFDTRHVNVWQRRTSAAATFAMETTDQIVDDAGAGAAVLVDTGFVLLDRIVSLGFGQFVVSDGGGDFAPNQLGVVYNFLAEG